MAESNAFIIADVVLERNRARKVIEAARKAHGMLPTVGRDELGLALDYYDGKISLEEYERGLEG